jgi:hypothetical protein
MGRLQPARLETQQQVLLARLMPNGGEGRFRLAMAPSRPQKYLILLNTYAKALCAAFFPLPNRRKYRYKAAQNIGQLPLHSHAI